ncbi:MAG: CinA family nicotinamide mononucleotide deamidase-related protein [Candidatus Marinimicrobia bacterium]|jgi:nicotinamide-nucleotide amidase|nr:CinA family nicotinamide mononucleotide deamidase-related protein [Candidatus Neomarinimicrobiota bacterium]MDP6611090.1 CinA family nicotinamide mononucleotide deamidase-related protein [Candidatus Neomarinimicrobiota bacterium]|tara:strand:+ start:3905 stop:5125 length:1221 start_codon:yes stop_codon:yes gene_type:complete
MKIGLITIGAELLNGTRTDTNAAWIGQKVIIAGGNIVWHMTVNDEKAPIEAALNEVPGDVDVVLCTGGLGPTHDDITATVLYKYFGAKEEFDQAYWELLTKKFVSRGRVIPKSNRNQAIRPDIGEVIPNTVGSARGLHFSNESYDCFATPGVPAEMKSMMTDTILPWIKSKSDAEIFVKVMRTTGIMESVLYEKIEHELKSYPDVNVAFLPRFTGVDLRITASEKKSLEQLIKQISPAIQKYHFGGEGVELEDAVGALLTAQNKTIATAESCTGGLIGDRLTNVSGSSSYFKGGIVAYSNAVKEEAVGVSKATLESVGAVSEETALEMARGVREKLNADIGISTTGIAGPTGGTEEKPVGLVFVGLSFEGGEKAYRFTFTPFRKTNKLMTSQAALNITRLYLLNGL